MTTEQLQALNAAAIAERRLEALENLELQGTVRPTDMESGEQARALRSQFDAGLRGGSTP
jgi:hypothetical protein